MNEINKLIEQIRIVTVIRNISIVVVVISGAILLYCKIKGHKEHRPFQLFDYYFDYYDENNKLLKSERISKEEFEKADKESVVYE